MENTLISPVLGFIAKLLGSKKSTYHQSIGANFGSIGSQTINQRINHDDHHHYQNNRILRTPMEEELILKRFNQIASCIDYSAVRNKDYGRKVFAAPFFIVLMIMVIIFFITAPFFPHQYSFIPILIVVGGITIGYITLGLTGKLMRPETLRFYDVIVDEIRLRQETTRTSKEENTTTLYEIFFLPPNGKRISLPENFNYKIVEGDYGIVIVSEDNKIVDFKKYFNGRLV